MNLRLLPTSLFARVTLILLAGLLAAQGLSLWLHWGERASVVSEARALNLADRIAEGIRRLEADASPGHHKAIAALQSDELRAALIGPDEVSPQPPRGQFPAAIASRLGSAREIRNAGTGGGMGMGMGRGMPSEVGGAHGWGSGRRGENVLRSFDVRLADGQWVRLTVARELAAPALPVTFYTHLLISLGVVLLVALFAVRQATQPLRRLSTAADQLGQNLDAPPLAENGSAEVRTAAQAFNRMRERIRRLIDERSRALAAVSHDLRTPLTRLRLRSELIDDERLREQFAADIDAMAQMIDATLDYLRGLGENEPLRPIDIDALLGSLVEDAATLGRAIAVEGSATAAYPGRLSALRRAVQNLIDNACKYGERPLIRVVDDADTLRLTVEDDGPGIPPEALARVTEPYFRPDTARSQAGGVGLGLSIVSDVAILHGGHLELANRQQGGLRATLVLPRRNR